MYWSDGSLVLDRVTGVSSSVVNFWGDRRWGYVDHVRPEGEVQS